MSKLTQNVVIKKIKSAHKAVFVAVLLVCIFILFFAIYSQNISSSNSKLVINNDTVITVQFARTPEEQTKGLCCRNSLPKNSGMLFVNEKPGNYRFWMKDTRIPLDMYWIDANKKIVHIEHNVRPSSYPKTFGTAIPAQYILETNAGYAKEKNITIGNTVSF